MKYSSTLFCLIACVLLSASAIAQAPSQPNYEKRVYKNNGNTYVQKSLPLYLNFSTTPGGENHKLTSKATAKYADPMYLDTEGLNYIRSKWAVDPETKRTVVPQQEVMYELYADGLAPTTTIRFSGAPRYVKGGTIFWGKGLQYDLTSKDGVAGVQKTQNSLNSNSYTDYSNTVSVGTEGAYNLYFYAADNVGNAEQARSRKFTVDITSPNTSNTIVGIKHGNNILAPSTKLSLSSNDALSGVNRVLYNFDNGSDRTYGNPVSIASLNDGQHTLYYHSVDNVKNDETPKSLSFYLDKIAPTSDASINGDFCEKGGVKYISNRTTISIASQDNKAGVKAIYYRIDGGERMTYSSNFKMTDKRGSHSIKYDAIDNVENLSGNKYLNVFMDNVTPETGIIYGKPQFFTRDTLFINSKTSVKLRYSDYGSGVVRTEYAVDGGSFKSYDPFTLPNNGYRTVSFKSTDCVNNVEQVKKSNCFVDNDAPVIHHNFSIEPIGDRKGVKIYPNYTRLYLGATDDHVGTEKILYSMNGGPLTDYSSPYTLDLSEVSRFKKNKQYKVRIVSRDKLGNESEKTIEFYVGRQKD